MARRPLLIGLGLFAVIAAILWIPWATQERVVTAATPVPPPLFGVTPAPLKGGSSACQQQVTFTPQTQIAQIGVNTGGGPGPALAVTATAPGYRMRSRVPAGYTTTNSLQFGIAAPKQAVIGTLCFRNTGRRAISLNGTTEFRTMGRPTLVIDGVTQPMDATLIFYARVRSSYLSRIGQIFTHAAVFTPAFFSKGVLIVLALLVLVGVPLAVAFALAGAIREDELRDEQTAD